MPGAASEAKPPGASPEAASNEEARPKEDAKPRVQQEQAPPPKQEQSAEQEKEGEKKKTFSKSAPETKPEAKTDAKKEQLPLPAAEAQLNHYEALGIGQRATSSEIKKGYYMKSKLFHPDKAHDDPYATSRFQRVAEAYGVLSNQNKRAQYDATLVMQQACGKLGVSSDPRATAFVQRHCQVVGREVSAMQVEARHVPFVIGTNGAQLHTLKMQSSTDILILQIQANQNAQVLIAGSEDSTARAKQLITDLVSEISGEKAPKDGIVLVLPQSIWHKIPQATPQLHGIYLQTGAVCRFASNDRIVVQGGTRIPQAVVQLQWLLEWKSTVLLHTGQKMDAWEYAHNCEAAGMAANPNLRLTCDSFSYLIPPQDPDAAQARRLLCLHLGTTTQIEAGSSLVELATRSLLSHHTGRPVTGAVIKAATCVAVHAEHASLPAADGAKLLCALHAVTSHAGGAIAPRFLNGPQFKALHALNYALQDPREGLVLRAKGFTAVQEAIPDDSQWHTWSSVLVPDGPLANFWKELRVWVGERHRQQGVPSPPADWLTAPTVMSSVLRMCIAPPLECDTKHGLKRSPGVVTVNSAQAPATTTVPAKARPQEPPSAGPATSAQQPQQRVAAKSGVPGPPPQPQQRERPPPIQASPAVLAAASISGQSSEDDIKAGRADTEYLTQVERVEEVLLGLSGGSGASATSEPAYVSLGMVTQEAQKKLPSSAERLSKKWYEAHRLSFELKKFHGSDDLRVRLTVGAQKRASAREREREARDQRVRELLIMEHVLPKLSADQLPRALRSQELAGLLCLVPIKSVSSGTGLSPALLSRLCNNGSAMPRNVLQELSPFPPALLMKAIVGAEKASREKWHSKSLDILLQAAALDFHALDNRPQCSLQIAAMALWAAARRPFDERLGATTCMLAASAAMRLQHELLPETGLAAISPDCSQFRPFAHLCAWLAHLVVTAGLKKEEKAEAKSSFKSLVDVCQDLGKAPENAPTDPEGLCRLAMAVSLMMREEPATFGSKGLDGLAKVCVQRAMDDGTEGWSPSLLAVLASAFAAVEVPNEGLFKKIGTLAEKHSKWSHADLMKLLHSAWQVGQLKLLDRLLKNLHGSGDLMMHVNRLAPRDVPVMLSVAEALSDSRIVEEVAKCQKEKLGSMGLATLTSVLKDWPRSLNSVRDSSSASSFIANVARAAADAVRSKAPTAAQLKTIVDALQEDPRSKGRLVDLTLAPMLLDSVPSALSSSSTSGLSSSASAELAASLDGLLGPFAVAGLQARRLEAACASRILLEFDRASPSTSSTSAAPAAGEALRSAVAAALALRDNVLASMPAALHAIVERLCKCQLPRSGSSAAVEVRRLCDRLLSAAAHVALSAAPGGAGEDRELASWVEKLERCLCEERSAIRERRLDWVEQLAMKRLPSASREALGSGWLRLLLLCSRKLTWDGGKTVLLEPPRLRGSLRRLADGFGSSGLLRKEFRSEVDALPADAADKPLPSNIVGGGSGSLGPSTLAGASAASNAYRARASGASAGGAGAPRPSAGAALRAGGRAPAAEASKRDGAGVVGGPPSSSSSSAGPSAARSPPGSLTVSGGWDQRIAEALKGTYMPDGMNHDRIVYRRVEPVSEENVVLYYWDDRDGEDEMGWWFGTEVGGEQCWARHAGASGGKLPPIRGWVVLHSGASDPALTVKVTPDEAATPRPAPGAGPSRAGAADRPGPYPVGAARPGAARQGPKPSTGPRLRGSIGAAFGACGGADGPGGGATGAAARNNGAAASAGVGARPSPRPSAVVGGRPSTAAAQASAPSAPSTGHRPPIGAKRPRPDDQRPAQLLEWLSSLDDGAGAMLQYADVLSAQFDGDLQQIAAAKVDGGGGGILGCVDPSFWDTVKVEKTGHKILFAKGIAKL